MWSIEREMIHAEFSDPENVDEEEEKKKREKTIFFVCLNNPEHKLQKITLIVEKTNVKIVSDCKCISANLEDYFRRLEEKMNEKHVCSNSNKNYVNCPKEPILYYVNGRKFWCSTCIERSVSGEKNDKEIFTDMEVKIDLECKGYSQNSIPCTNKNRAISHYCLNCAEHYCENHINDFKHKCHQTAKLSEELDDEELKKIKENFNKRKNYEKEVKKEKEYAIKQLKDKIEQIEKAYQEYQERNSVIIKFFETIIKNNEIIKINYPLKATLKKNAFFDFRKLEDQKEDDAGEKKKSEWEIISQRVERLKNFLETNFFVKKKHLQDFKEKKLVGKSGKTKCMLLLDDNHIAGGCADSSIYIFDIKANSCVVNVNPFFNRHTDAINYLCKLNENIIASCSDDCTVRIWKLKNNFSDYSFKKVLKSHSSSVQKVIPLYDNYFASCSYDNYIKAYSFENEKYPEVGSIETKGPVICMIYLTSIPRKTLLSLSTSPTKEKENDGDLLTFWETMKDEKGLSFRSYADIRNVSTSSLDGMHEIKLKKKVLIGGKGQIYVINIEERVLEATISPNKSNPSTQPTSGANITSFVQLDDVMIVCANCFKKKKEEKIYAELIQLKAGSYAFDEKIIGHNFETKNRIELENNVGLDFNDILYCNLIKISETSFASCSNEKMIKIWNF